METETSENKSYGLSWNNEIMNMKNGTTQTHKNETKRWNRIRNKFKKYEMSRTKVEVFSFYCFNL